MAFLAIVAGKGVSRGARPTPAARAALLGLRCVWRRWDGRFALLLPVYDAIGAVASRFAAVFCGVWPVARNDARAPCVVCPVASLLSRAEHALSGVDSRSEYRRLRAKKSRDLGRGFCFLLQAVQLKNSLTRSVQDLLCGEWRSPPSFSEASNWRRMFFWSSLRRTGVSTTTWQYRSPG